ncbi:MAG: hypothetical protein IPF75_11495 [Bacteroidetes bacterium]|nr:hypothetical protein [Bacteroidota bacterium]
MFGEPCSTVPVRRGRTLFNWLVKGQRSRSHGLAKL